MKLYLLLLLFTSYVTVYASQNRAGRCELFCSGFQDAAPGDVSSPSFTQLIAEVDIELGLPENQDAFDDLANRAEEIDCTRLLHGMSDILRINPKYGVLVGGLASFMSVWGWLVYNGHIPV